ARRWRISLAVGAGFWPSGCASARGRTPRSNFGSRVRWKGRAVCMKVCFCAAVALPRTVVVYRPARAPACLVEDKPLQGVGAHGIPLYVLVEAASLLRDFERRVGFLAHGRNDSVGGRVTHCRAAAQPCRSLWLAGT